MLFSILLSVLNFMIGLSVKNNRSVKEMVTIRNCVYVIMTKDGKIGRRFIFRYGKFTSDKIIKDYDLALVFEDAKIGFKAMALDGLTGMTKAINNFELQLVGNQKIYNFFGVVIAVSMGMMKRP